MGKKKEIIRPDSYALNEFSASHLRMLHARLHEFIEIIFPAFAQAHKDIPFSEGKMNCIQHGKENDRFVDAKDLCLWLFHKHEKLGKFIEKVEAGERNLSGKPLNNIRHIRAFSSRFESIAKSKTQYGGVSMFESAEPVLSKILLEHFVPARNEGGIFELTRHLLRDEDFHSKNDLGKIRHDVRVGKTITYVVAAHIKLKEMHLTGEADDLAHPSDDSPAAIAATPKSRKIVNEEFGFDDPRQEKPTKPARIKARGKTGDRNQKELNL